MSFSFDDAIYMDMLNRQTIHMDQGACYNPEYLASRNMRDYPSRIMQIIRAVYLGQLPASPEGAEVVFRSLLSGQGERWQNFGESPYDYLFCQLLGRELFAKEGFGAVPASEEQEVKQLLVRDVDSVRVDELNEALRPFESSDTALWLDTDTVEYMNQAGTYARGINGLARFFKANHIEVKRVKSMETGFNFMAHGWLEDGADELRKSIQDLEIRDVKRVITLSGQASFCLNVLAPAMGIEYGFEVVDILDIANGLECDRAYVYGGSFYTRYMGKAGRIAVLTANTTERPAGNAWEFQPAVMGDRRVNGMTIWQTPVCAEFGRWQDYTSEAILAAGIERINAIPHKQLLVCDPLAYCALNEEGVAGLRYFWEALY